MRTRLLLVYLALVAGLLALLGIPLARAHAELAWQRLAWQRLLDTDDLAARAASALLAGRPERLPALVGEVAHRHGLDALVTDPAGHTLAVVGPRAEELDGEARVALARALRGERAVVRGDLLPRRGQVLVVALPLDTGGRPRGAVLTRSSTAALRDAILARWLLLFYGGVAVLLLAGGAAVPVARWILWPVAAFDETVQELASGRHSARVPGNVGPPELRRLARNVNALADTVQSLIERQRSFLADASHQLRNPLLALRLRVENLEPHVTPEGRRAHARVLEDVERLGRTLEEITALARVAEDDAGPEEVDVRAAVESRARSWAPVAKGRDLRIRLRLPRAARALARPGALEQTLDVLLDNALKYSPPGREVTVTVLPRTTHVDVHVLDEGPGMTEEERARAGERGWRGQRNTDGAGLGLSIARMLITSSGGQLELLPGPDGRGLDARVRLATPAAGPGDAAHRRPGGWRQD